MTPLGEEISSLQSCDKLIDPCLIETRGQHQQFLVWPTKNATFIRTRRLADTIFGEAFIYTEMAAPEFKDPVNPPKHVVVKVSPKKRVAARVSCFGDKVQEDIIGEHRILRGLLAEGHENITEMVALLNDQSFFYSVYPFYCGGDLFDHIAKQNRLPDNETVSFMLDIVAGVQFLHSRNVVHLDLSPENILLDKRADGTIKAVIIDFGLSKVVTSNGQINSSQTGKDRYMSPEMYSNSNRSILAKPCDVWSLGVILFVMLMGIPLYETPHVSSGSYKFAVIQRKFSTIMSSWGRSEVPEAAMDLLMNILTIEPMNRPTIEQIRIHPFLNT